MNSAAHPANRTIVATATLAVLISGAAVQLACHRKPGADVVADYVGGVVTADDLDAAVVNLPPNRRSAFASADRSQWETLVSEIVMRRLLGEHADRDGFSSHEEFLIQSYDISRRTAVTLCVDRVTRNVEPPVSAQIDEYLQTRGDSLSHPAKRLVFQIFLSKRPETSFADLEARALDLRAQHLAGVGFENLARQFSDSETRFQGGQVGWFVAREEQTDLERLVFSLDVGVPSMPVSTPEGVHLFLVRVEVEATNPTREEQVAWARAALAQHDADELVGHFLEDFDDGPNGFVAAPGDLMEIVNFGADDTEVFRIGTQSMDVELFRNYLGEAADKAGHDPSPELAFELYRTLVRRERLYHHCLATSTVRQEEIDDATAPAEERLLVAVARNTAMRELALEDEQAIRSFFDRRWRRFAGETELDLQLVSVPVTDDPVQQSDCLERAAEAVTAGRIDIDRAAADCRATITGLGWQPIGKLTAAYPKLAPVLASAEIDSFTPPMVIGPEVVVAVVADRRSPERPDFEDVADAVADAYVVEHRQQLYGELESRMLAEVGFTIHDAALDAAMAAGRAGTEPPETPEDA